MINRLHFVVLLALLTVAKAEARPKFLVEGKRAWQRVGMCLQKSARGSLRVKRQVAKELSTGYRELGVDVVGDVPRHRASKSRHGNRRLRAANAFIRAQAAHDPHLRGHAMRTSAYARVIARQLGLSKRQVTDLDLAGRVHDLGKLGVARRVLHNRTGRKPVPRDWKTIEAHPALGAQLLEVPGMRRVRRIIVGHHENLDGSGYPAKKKANKISLATRILAVADAFDAMTCDRTYQRAMTPKAAIGKLRELGKRYDARVVEALVTALPRNPLAQAALRWAQRSPLP